MRNAAAFWLVLIVIVSRALGCEARPLELRKVSFDVVLAVTHHGKPIAGIEIKIFRERTAIPVLTATTNKRGTVSPGHLAGGKYFVYASHEGFDAPTEWIEVVRPTEPNVARRIEIQWADWSYEVSRVSGTLTGLIPGNTGNKIMDVVHPVATTYPGVAIDLKHAFSSEDHQTLSGSIGEFIFPDIPDGTYILSIAGGMNSVSGVAGITRLVLDIARGSTVSSLPLELRDNGCGAIEFQLKEN